MLIELIADNLKQIKLQSKVSAWTASVIVVSTLLYGFIQKYNRPPAHLAHLPYISLFTFIKCVFKDVTYEDYIKENVLPILTKESSGVYVAPTIQRWVVRIADPVPMKQFLMKQESSLPKAESNAGMKGSLIHRFIGGPNILLQSGAEWRKHRKIANAAFRESMPIKLFGQLAQKTLKNIKVESGPVNVHSLFQRFALDSIGIAGFGFDFHAIEDKESEWVNYYDSIMKGMAQPFYILLPIFDTRYLHWFEKRQQVHDYLSKLLEKMDVMIDERRKQVLENTSSTSNPEKDLLTLMIESEANAGEGLTNEELRADLCIFFLAGHDTTASALSTVVYELAKHQDVQEKAREEALRILGQENDSMPTLDQIKQFDYINRVIKENLRKHPPAFNTTDRTSREDLVLGNVAIPKGTHLGFDLYSLQHNPNLWSDPFVFNPDRFEPNGEADQIHALSWAPFSSGSRHCVGMNFSLAEQRVALAMLLKKYTWTLPKDSKHTDRIEKGGIAWGMAIYKHKIEIDFKSRD
ncbi:cytochrome P450 [Sporodiniella umbellata]|nr:cytochrome P450 [Sporodiniella umbellata]